jgi:hypothetical protein
MSLETLEKTLNQIDADTAAQLANGAPTTIDVEVVPSEPVSAIETEVIPAESNPEKDGTPIVAAETLIPNNETVIDVEATVVYSEPNQTPVVENQTLATSEPVAEQTTTTQTPIAPSPVSIPVPSPTEVRSVNLMFPQGNFSKSDVQSLNKIEYVTASGIVNLLEAKGIVKPVGKKQGLGRGKPTILYAFN